MQFMTTWGDPENGQLVFFTPEVLAVFERFIQGDSQTEAGGLLLGHVRDIHREILEATIPTPLDRRFKYLFERLAFGHRVIADRRWSASNGQIRYVGEWHTHPQDHPVPSNTDIYEWRQLARQRLDRKPLLVVIVGRKDLRVEVMNAYGTRQRLFPVEL
jgi:integrative and conjugative element protein (TIGR02256 family)